MGVVCIVSQQNMLVKKIKKIMPASNLLAFFRFYHWAGAHTD